MVMFLVGSASAFAATTAVDTVGTAFTAATGNIALLGVVAGNKVTLHTNGGDYGVDTTVIGAKPMVSGSIKHTDTADGGFLQYTLFGYTGTSKITVEMSEGASVTALKVKAYHPSTSGSCLNNLGTSETAYREIPDNGSPRDLITLISNGNTWTGTAAADGARLSYKLTDEPNIAAVSVLYTLVASN